MTAAQNAVPGNQAKQPAAPGRPGSLWAQGLACGALLAFATPTALVVGILMAPVWAAMLAEAAPRDGMPRGVALVCAAAAMAPVWHLWMAGDRIDAVLPLLSDPLTLLLAWGGGACAWAMCQILPVLVRTTWEARDAVHAKALRQEAARLREEWDLPSPETAPNEKGAL